ncbi:hypothetical protein SADUNF_Sadunf10G0146600 [Salix dunnii]|uniref:TF-B3 domain-containing protein n=1 Tax=Salix dunnii TaxID=1413687 RepID=A0A835JNS2_9ROSI|nr:hypothetical protein SADUNF_Sadunf10G0146600 [Salix dunnii]
MSSGLRVSMMHAIAIDSFDIEVTPIPVLLDEMKDEGYVESLDTHYCRALESRAFNVNARGEGGGGGGGGGGEQRARSIVRHCENELLPECEIIEFVPCGLQRLRKKARGQFMLPGCSKLKSPFMYISKGWKEFSQENNLKEGDVCVFELINKRKFFVNLKIVCLRIKLRQIAMHTSCPQLMFQQVGTIAFWFSPLVFYFISMQLKAHDNREEIISQLIMDPIESNKQTNTGPLMGQLLVHISGKSNLR